MYPSARPLPSLNTTQLSTENSPRKHIAKPKQMAEALMLRAPTSRLANQIRSHARVLASLKLRPAPGEYTCAAREAVQPRPRKDRAETGVSLTSEERAHVDREQQAGCDAPPAPEGTPLLSTGKTALRTATTTTKKPSKSQVSLHPSNFEFSSIPLTFYSFSLEPLDGRQTRQGGKLLG